MTFPTDPKGKAVAFRLMKRIAPDLMADIVAWQKQWGGEMTYFKGGGLEYGEPSPPGWQVDQQCVDRAFPAKPSTEALERARKDRLATNARKAKARR